MLYNNDTQNQNSIVLNTGLNKVKVNRLINNLEEKKIVKRDTCEKDKRFNNIILTEKGNICYDKIAPLASSVIQNALNELKYNEKEQGIVFLKNMFNNLDSENNK